MKILYAFQGTGNGHASRARALLPELARHADVDVATSGSNFQLDIGHPVSFSFAGLSFHPGGNGKISKWGTVKSWRLGKAFRDASSLDLTSYDFVINDFEPITAYAAKQSRTPSVALSHQASFLSKKTPRPDNANPLCEAVFRWYAPAQQKIGFHFDRYDSFILPPILREEIRTAQPENHGHLTVYLPGYNDQNLIPLFRTLGPKPVHLFSRTARGSFTTDNIHVHCVSHERFMHSLITCDAFLTGAGFEGPAEALHLGKKLMVVPLGGQYEQKCNAAALARLGVPVLSAVDENSFEQVRDWAFNGEAFEIRFPDTKVEAVERILSLRQ